MGQKNYRDILIKEIQAAFKHLARLNEAHKLLHNKYSFPINKTSYEKIVSNPIDLALADQIIYRFSKLQDTLGAKIFKNFLLYQGENVNKPFLDILNRLEEIGLIDVERWFEIRDLRNEIAHDYENDDFEAVEIINEIINAKKELEKTLNKLKEMI
ncbi:hypothetical protein [Caminibacter pacificus]